MKKTGILINKNYGYFNQIPKLIIEDQNISPSAFRQYAYLIGKPTGWKVRNTDIKNRLGISIDTVTKNFKILITNRWMDRDLCRASKGKFEGGFNYEIYHIPTGTGEYPYRGSSKYGKNLEFSDTYTSWDAMLGLVEIEKEKKKEVKGRYYVNKPKNSKNPTATDAVRLNKDVYTNTNSHSTNNFLKENSFRNEEIPF